MVRSQVRSQVRFPGSSVELIAVDFLVGHGRAVGFGKFTEFCDLLLALGAARRTCVVLGSTTLYAQQTAVRSGRPQLVCHHLSCLSTPVVAHKPRALSPWRSAAPAARRPSPANLRPCVPPHPLASQLLQPLTQGRRHESRLAACAALPTGPRVRTGRCCLLRARGQSSRAWPLDYLAK